MRIFSTLVPWQNENKSCMRIDGSWQAIVYILNFVVTPRNFIIAKLSIRKPGFSSVLIVSSDSLHLSFLNSRTLFKKKRRVP